MNEYEPHDHSPIDINSLKFCVRCGNQLVEELKEGKLFPMCIKCNKVYYADPKVAAGTIIESDRRVLLLRRGTEPKRGLWTFPGGYVDQGEPVPEAAAREAYEETGIKVKIGNLLGVYCQRGDPVVLIVYQAEIESGKAKRGVEAADFLWVAEEQIPWDQLAFISTESALTDWCKILRK